MKKTIKKVHNPYEEMRNEGVFTVSAPFNFVLKDPSIVINDEGAEVWDRSYLEAASRIYQNNVFHQEMALLSGDLANSITKDSFDAVTKALRYVKDLSPRFEMLHNKLIELDAAAKADRESVQKSSSDISGSLEFPVDLQV